MFEDILQNVSQHSVECLVTFPGMFNGIPWNITSPLFPAFPAFRSLFLYSWFYTFNLGLFCLINKDSDTFQGCCQNLKGQGSKPEKIAQFILNHILVFTFNFIYLIFKYYRFPKHFLECFLINIWATLFLSQCLIFVVRNTFLVIFQSSELAL